MLSALNTVLKVIAPQGALKVKKNKSHGQGAFIYTGFSSFEPNPGVSVLCLVHYGSLGRVEHNNKSYAFFLQ